MTSKIYGTTTTTTTAQDKTKATEDGAQSARARRSRVCIWLVSFTAFAICDCKTSPAQYIAIISCTSNVCSAA